jgi:hypothetical protein
MPHPCDHPAAALAITRGVPSQLQKAKQAGDHAAVAAIEVALVRARRIVAAGNSPQPQHARAPAPAPIPPPPPQDEGWAEIIQDRRQRGRRW